MKEIVLEVSRLSHHFKEDVLRDVSFSVLHGEFVSLLGSSGAGKTTILRLIAGLDRPDVGEIGVNGRVVTSSSLGIFVPPQDRGVGLVFQSYALWPHLSVFENLAFPLRVRGWGKEVIRWRVSKTLSFLSLDGLEQRLPSQLSGGQQQRVALGRALIYEPQMLLLDEPLANVDPKNREKIAAGIRDILKGLGIGVLYVTHDQREALSVSDRIVLIEKGRVIQDGSPEDLYFRPSHPESADFFGASNQILGVFRKIPTGDVLELAGAVLPWSANDFHDGDNVVAYLRPVDFELQYVLDPAVQQVGWHGEVKSVDFYWETRRLTIRAQGLDFMVHESHLVVERGQPVFLSVKPGRLKAFRADA